MKETVTWKESFDSLQRKGNNVFEIESSKGRIIRKDVPPQLTYQLFLDEESYIKIKEILGGGSWTYYNGSAIHYYGGNYIYVKGNGAMPKIKEILNLNINW
jgi:hypothetical protein